MRPEADCRHRADSASISVSIGTANKVHYVRPFERGCCAPVPQHLEDAQRQQPPGQPLQQRARRGAPRRAPDPEPKVAPQGDLLDSSRHRGTETQQTYKYLLQETPETYQSLNTNAITTSVALLSMQLQLTLNNATRDMTRHLLTGRLQAAGRRMHRRTMAAGLTKLRTSKHIAPLSRRAWRGGRWQCWTRRARCAASPCPASSRCRGPTAAAATSRRVKFLLPMKEQCASSINVRHSTGRSSHTSISNLTPVPALEMRRECWRAGLHDLSRHQDPGGDRLLAGAFYTVSFTTATAGDVS